MEIKMKQYFVHNGFSAGSGKLPADPQLISEQDADKLMQFAGLEPKHVGNLTPPAQFAEEGDWLFRLFANNRFLCYADPTLFSHACPRKKGEPLALNW
jgi:hypothetical protein